MDAQFKKRVQALQTEHGRPATAAAPDQHSATKYNHTLPTHHPGLISPSSANHTALTGRSTGGAIRTTVAGVRAARARARGPLGTSTGVGIGRSVFGVAANLSVPSPAAAAATSSPKRATGTHLSSPLGVSTRRSPNADLSTNPAANRSTSGGASQKTRAPGNTAGADQNSVSTNNGTTDQSNDNKGSTDTAKNIDAPNANVSLDSKRGSSSTQPTKENIVVSGPNPAVRSPGWKSPSKKRIFDRYDEAVNDLCYSC